jgi:CheY-like chemotaxis protein
MSAVVAQPDEPGPSAPQARGLRILVVDDSPSVRALLRGFLVREGHEVLAAEDGAAAMELFDAGRPDVVLMDVMMPNMDGIEATRLLRAGARERWVPVILLSALDAEDDVVRGLGAGADDYLVKPINLSILKAKISSFQRIAGLQRQLLDQAATLAQFREAQLAELELAGALIANIVRRDSLDDPALAWEVLPSERFSGDVVAAARSPTGELYTMLGDATGHGLTASVSLIPALQVFYGMVRRALPLADMVREINGRLKDLLPVGRYLAAALMVVDERRRRAEVWNGGMPQAFLLDAGGGICRVFASAHLPLGIAADAEFDGTCTRFDWDAPSEIVFFSDGVPEAEDAHGRPFGAERLAQILCASVAGGRAARIMQSLRGHLGTTQAIDDASILAVRLP